MRLVKAIEAHEIPGRPPIQVTVGQEVQVGERDTEWPAFVFVTTSQGSGWVPARHLSTLADRATVQRDYDTTELATRVGETLEVIVEDTESGWLWCRSSTGTEGWVPLSTVE